MKMFISSVRQLVEDHEPACLAPSITVREACHVLNRHDIGAVAVIEDDLLIGILSERNAWPQVSSATFDLTAATSSAMTSVGVLQPSVFLGRLFINAATSLSQVWLASVRSVPLDMN